MDTDGICKVLEPTEQIQDKNTYHHSLIK